MNRPIAKEKRPVDAVLNGSCLLSGGNKGSETGKKEKRREGDAASAASRGLNSKLALR